MFWPPPSMIAGGVARGGGEDDLPLELIVMDQASYCTEYYPMYDAPTTYGLVLRTE